MDFDSPDVEKDFPGLYASESVDGKSKKSKEESDYSEGDHEKVSKKDLLIGRRKEKKDKGKDRGYAALEGESSPEEELEAKSPSKSKKSKTFKFTSSKSKEKREKSRDKEKLDKDQIQDEKTKEKDKTEKDKETKKKDKERKEKEKKEKSKDKEKDKKDKKTKQLSIASEEVLELGDAQPVFGVSVSLATERSRCHDGIDLPLVVRDCIDYLQENALKCEQIYKVETVKTRLQHFKRLYNNRERQPETDELDMPTACGLLKLYLRELPEPILTTDLIARFEEVAAHPQVTKQQEELQQLHNLLPSCNKTLLSWILLHFDAVIQNEMHNKMNAQSLAMLLSPVLQMSHRLLVTLLCHCPNLFADVHLIKYVPPITSSSPKLPDNPDELQTELRKQESLLAQIHAEMNAGFVSKKREEQLWEVQRIITQLKRKLRGFEKKQEKSIDELQSVPVSCDTTDAKAKIALTKQTKLSCSDDEPTKAICTMHSNESAESTEAKNTPQQEIIDCMPIAIPEENLNDALTELTIDDKRHPDGLYIDEETKFLMVPKTHADYETLLRLQLENQELIAWKTQLQTRISAERAEILRLKQQLQRQPIRRTAEEHISESDCEKLIGTYMRENKLLEQKKLILANEIFQENKDLIGLQVELLMRQYQK
ncbi:ralA-binding protein 1 [Teleopsis dalmanni]|uniref:ralA-binding protein 1 n=2 Tax=Teleopsis dalmanni TaxID=139649 RepID=UPI0018CE98A2|nr:ralA-binding protein 1 [Teleopsis dalmanni]